MHWAALAAALSLALPSQPRQATLPAPVPAASGVPGSGPIGPIERIVSQVAVRDLARRGLASGQAFCVESNTIAACLAPGTSPEYARRILARLYGEGTVGPRYALSARWTNTASGSTGLPGTPIHLTYSFVPDGLTIPDAAAGGSDPSTLFATLDAQFGSTAAWQAKFAQVFQRWGELAGITYTQVGDDGAAFVFNPGSNTAPVRGDIRIAAIPLDGAFNVLAYSYFPDFSDMVLDTSENWANGFADYLFLRNTLAHEHGHGIGFDHVWPIDQTKLMEPFLSAAFDGPQDDDIRGANRNYGDHREDNDTLGTATALGALPASPSVPLASLDSSSDEDWYSFTVTAGQTLTLNLNPIGATYNVGPSSGSTVSVNTLAINNLDLEVYNASSVLMASGNTQPAGVAETISSLSLASAGGLIYVRVLNHAGGVDDVQRYTLTGTATTAIPTSVSVAGAAGTVGQTVQLSATLIDTSSGDPIAGQTVDFTVAGDGGTYTSGATGVDGIATYDYTIPEGAGPGSRSVTATFNGGGGYAGSAGNGSLVVSKAATRAWVGDRTQTTGRTVYYWGYLHRQDNDSVIPGRTVHLSVNGSRVDSGVTDGSGRALLSYVVPVGTAPGSVPVAVEFDEDTGYLASSDPGALNVTVETRSWVGNRTVKAGKLAAFWGYLVRKDNGAALAGQTVHLRLFGNRVASGVIDGTGRVLLTYAIPADTVPDDYAVQVEFDAAGGYLASSWSATLTVTAP